VALKTSTLLWILSVLISEISPQTKKPGNPA